MLIRDNNIAVEWGDHNDREYRIGDDDCEWIDQYILDSVYDEARDRIISGYGDED